MSTNVLLKSPPDSWSQIKVQSLDSIGEVSSKDNLHAPVLKLDSQLVDPLIPPPGTSELYYNSTTGALR